MLTEKFNPPSEVLKAFASFLFSTKVNHLLQNHVVSWQICTTGAAENTLPTVKTNKQLAWGLLRWHGVSSNNLGPWIKAPPPVSTRMPGLPARSFSFQALVLLSGQDYRMARSSHVRSSFHRPSPGCLQPHRSSCPSSSPHLLSPPANLPSAPGPALPELVPKAARPYSLCQPTRPEVVRRQVFCWERHPSVPGHVSRLGRALAYLLAEEEALGGEHGEAVGWCALGRAVGAGGLADFSLLLLTQTEESVWGPHRWRPCESGLFQQTGEKKASPIILKRKQKTKPLPALSIWGLQACIQAQAFHTEC